MSAGRIAVPVPESGQTPQVLWQLDAVRGAAACYIATAHLARDQLGPMVPGLRFLLGFGQEAVIVFFLLSGFVIHWSTAQKPGLEFGAYLRARALRIYPLLILTLALAGVVAWIQGATDPRVSWKVLLGNLLMLQDWGEIKPGVWVDTYAGILVLWSLSYEWWFYMLYYPLSRKFSASSQIWAVAAISISQAVVYALYPNQASRFLLYFCIWWTGVEMARAKLAGRPLTLVTLAKPLTIVALAGAFLGFGVWRDHAAGVALRPGVHPVLELRHFAAALGIVLLALLWHRNQWLGFRRLFGVFIPVAPFGYGLYLLHEPLALHANLMRFAAAPVLQFLLNAVMVLAAAWFAENYFQAWCRRAWAK